MLLDNFHDGIEVVGVAKSMGKEYGSGFWTDGLCKLFYVYIVRANVHIHKNRHHAILYNRVDGGRETGGNGYDLVARYQALFAEQGGHERS